MIINMEMVAGIHIKKGNKVSNIFLSYLELFEQFILIHQIYFVPTMPWPLEITSQNVSNFTPT